MPSHKPLTPEMDELLMSEEALIAAAKAAREFDVEVCGDTNAASFADEPPETQMEYGAQAERVVHAFLQAEGFEVEHKYVKGEPLRVVRLIGRWKPEQGTDSPSSSSGMDSGDAGSTP